MGKESVDVPPFGDDDKEPMIKSLNKKKFSVDIPTIGDDDKENTSEITEDEKKED